MLSLPQLFKAIDKFYSLAVKSFSIFKNAAGEETDVLQKAEDVWDQIDNPQLANQMEQLIDSYKGFLNSMFVQPSDFMKGTEQAAEDSAENFNDHIEALNTRFQRIIGNPYLNLSPDDPKWTEELSPGEIKTTIEALVEDANTRLQQQASDIGVTPEEIRHAQESAREAQQMVTTTEGLDSKEIDVSNQKIKQQLEYSKKARQKRALVARIGMENLIRHRAALETQISQETNLEKKKELERRLSDLPNPESYAKYKVRQKEAWDRIMSDPTKRADYFKKALPRLQSSRGFAKKFEDITKEYDQGGPNEKARAKMKMVQLMKELLKRKNIDIDDDFVLNSPEVQKELNPDNIMAKYRNRKARIKDEEKRHLTMRQTEKAKGDLKGLIIQFRERINNIIKDTKDSLERQLAKSPEMKPYKEAIAKAKASGDANALQIAKNNEIAFLKSDFCNNFRLNHPSTKAAAAVVAEFRDWRDRVGQLDESKALQSEPLPETIVQSVHQLISHGKNLITKYSSTYKTVSERANDIVQFLEAKVSQ